MNFLGERGAENLFRSKLVDDEEEDEGFECGLFCQGSNGMWEAALMKFGAKVFGSPQHCMRQLVALVMNMIGANAPSSKEGGVPPEDLVQGCMLLNTCFETCSNFGCIDSEAIPALAAHVVQVCVAHEAVAVRREAIKLCGMFMLHTNCSNESLLGVFSSWPRWSGCSKGAKSNAFERVG